MTFDSALNLVDYYGGASHVNISDTVNNLFNKRYYHVEQQAEIVGNRQLQDQNGLLHYHDEKIGKLNQQYAEIAERSFVQPARRPFEEI